MASYRVRLKDQERGPYAVDRMIAFKAEGKLKPHFEVSKDQGPWKPASSFSELFDPRDVPEPEMKLELDDNPRWGSSTPSAPPPPPPPGTPRPAQSPPQEQKLPQGSPYGGSPYSGSPYQADTRKDVFAPELRQRAATVLGFCGFGLSFFSLYLDWLFRAPGISLIFHYHPLYRIEAWYSRTAYAVAFAFLLVLVFAVRTALFTFINEDTIKERRRGIISILSVTALFLIWLQVMEIPFGLIETSFYALPAGAALLAASIFIQPK